MKHYVFQDKDVFEPGKPPQYKKHQPWAEWYILYLVQKGPSVHKTGMGLGFDHKLPDTNCRAFT